MKKIITGILAVLFIGLLYLNFGMTKESQIVKPLESKKEKTTFTKKNDNKVNNEKDKNNETASLEEKSREDATLIFNNENLNHTYQTLKENNEPLVVSVLLPNYYSDSFIEELESEFNTNSVQFKRIDIDSNTTNLESLSAYENSNVVILSALQIQDYNDEVLDEHNIESVLRYYMTFYNRGITSIVLSDPNAYAHKNLENTLLIDQEYMFNNDFYFINNLNVNLESMYNEETETFSKEAEKQIQNNIKEFLIK